LRSRLLAPATQSGARRSWRTLVPIDVSLHAFDLDRAVLQQSYEGANGCEHRRKDRTDHASREREFGHDATFMLHHDASDVALVG
jgi:hypothetical protein